MKTLSRISAVAIACIATLAAGTAAAHGGPDWHDHPRWEQERQRERYEFRREQWERKREMRERYAAERWDRHQRREAWEWRHVHDRHCGHVRYIEPVMVPAPVYRRPVVTVEFPPIVFPLR